MVKKLIMPAIIAIMVIFTSQTGNTVYAAETAVKQSTIETSATGELEVTPDIAYINANVSIINESKDKSFNTNKESVNSLVKALIDAKIPKADIVTLSFYSSAYIDRVIEDPKAAYPVYKDVKKYQTTTNLKITVRNVGNVGDIIEKMLDVENVDIYNVSYSISNISNYKKEAIKRAVSAARENIVFAAEASNVKLDKLQLMTVDFYNNVYQPYPMYAKAMDGAAPAPMYQNPGNIKVSATVRMIYLTK